MSDPEKTLGDLAEFGCEHLPEDWSLSVTMTDGCLDVTLRNPDGDRVERLFHDNADLPEMIRDYVNIARTEDGLEPVGWDGEHDPFWE